MPHVESGVQQARPRSIMSLPTAVLRLFARLFQLALPLPWIGDRAWSLCHRVRETFAHDIDVDTTYGGGVRFRANLADHIESQIFWQGAQEGDRGEIRLLGRLLRPDHVFFDIGANVGVFSLYAAKRLTSGEVHAFEPLQQHLSRFSTNLELNGFSNIKVNPVALSRKPGSRTLYVPNTNNTGMASFYADETDPNGFAGHGITTTTLDQYVSDMQIKRLDIIKIDVEGAELDALEGGRETIRRFRPRVMMEVNVSHLRRAGKTLDDLVGFWADLGYSMFRIEHSGTFTHITDIGSFAEHQNIFCDPNYEPGAH